MENKYSSRRHWGSILTGVFLLISGLFLITWKQLFITEILELVVFILIGDALRRTYIIIRDYQRVNQGHTINRIIIVVGELALAIILNLFPGMTTYVLIRSIGIYYLLLGVVNTITSVLMVKNKAKHTLPRILMTMFFYLLAIIALTANQSSMTILNLMGAYLILIGLTYIKDGRRVLLSKSREDQMRRQIRFPLPIALNFLLPRAVLSRLNIFLENEFFTPDLKDRYLKKQVEGSPEAAHFEILIHTSRHGFGAIGHVNIAYQGLVYNYGNHDVDSRYFLGIIGDGVLAVANKEKFIEASMVAGDTIFEFVVNLTDLQKEKFEEKLDNLKSQLEPWEPESVAQKKAFGGFLMRRADANLYKFTSGRFKNYFVGGTNCVLLSDELIGASGLDLFAMVGFLTPGTYFDYLNREYKKEGIIINQQIIHSRRLRKKIRNL